jgi:DNA mismatch repair protein MutL
MSIIQMPEHLANKIAAGEVVERPASVVKELVENSIDANSTSIKIELEEAGLQSIKVTDNGKGMPAEDAEKAFLRHATSKIIDENDLFHVKTLGFRGEALASIASVSRMSIKTSEGSEAGTFIRLEGGKVAEKKKTDARKGTEIVIQDLFFNTPARLKYMKSLHTELGHVTDVLNRLSLSHPSIRFEVIHNGKVLFQTSGTRDLLQVIAKVYGMNVARKMLYVEKESLDFKVSGYIGKPEVTRASRSYISTIVNGRYIKNIPLQKAVIQGYDALLMIGRFPIVVLQIEMDPILVDVNVHPTKLEVRFSKDKELYRLIEEMIREKFQKSTLIPEVVQQPKSKLSAQSEMNLEPAEESEKPEPVISEMNWETRPFVHESFPEHKTELRQETQTFQSFEDADEGLKETVLEEKIPQTTDRQIQTKSARVPVMYPVGQLHGTYIIAQNENGMYMIDQHAAQERIKYEQFKENLGDPNQELQELLIPLTFEFSKQEALFIEQYEEELKKAGLLFEPFGQQTYIIRSHPNWFPSGYEEEIIREMVEQIIDNEKIDIELLRNDAAALMSCKRSIKANHYLNQEEMFQLLEELRGTNDPFTCPHGRPVIIHFSSYEIEKMFKRVL